MLTEDEPERGSLKKKNPHTNVPQLTLLETYKHANKRNIQIFQYKFLNWQNNRDHDIMSRWYINKEGYQEGDGTDFFYFRSLWIYEVIIDKIIIFVSIADIMCF